MAVIDFKGFLKQLTGDIILVALSRILIIGLALAVFISAEQAHNPLWVIVHGLLGWTYVFYYTQNWLMFAVSLLYFGVIGKKLYKNISIAYKVSKQ